MCVNIFPEDLNSDLYSPHLTITYTYGVTITSKVRGGFLRELL